ncbi:NUDIX domain-containing protein [Candidatus Gracilibacteria bacterium]|jgi:8-oxo-dGTP diphosphatase|nr:NUDIX domain-containing protein [Candidatus Gracilibacteria bacterium]NJM87142.1 NUDIX domain-containing protein [Hydrococcus sp. RU_2_2]NJP19289.1 NUDIX domain-containing protein [Hydrococcus sp. CRU_1_1]NJQ98486.1 NUDIX domain-containing protein [Hydrococcus sp. CSU_1_8]
MNETPVSVALAILTQNDQFLMQLRDDKPDIAYPGHWGLFGGHLELNETPEEGLKREVLEEIEYTITNLVKFRCYGDSKITRHIYYAPLTVPIGHLILHEGWDLALVPPEAIRQGSYYSAKANRISPLGGIHQQILLDFIKAEL